MFDTDKQSTLIAETQKDGTNKTPRDDASNVIPFPDVRGLHRQAEKTKPHVAGSLVRRAVCKMKDAVLRLACDVNTVGAPRKRGSTAASAAHRLQHRRPTLQGYGDSAVRRRMSA